MRCTDDNLTCCSVTKGGEGGEQRLRRLSRWGTEGAAQREWQGGFSWLSAGRTDVATVCTTNHPDLVGSVSLWWRLSTWHNFNRGDYNHHFDSQQTSRRSPFIPHKTTLQLQYMNEKSFFCFFKPYTSSGLPWWFVASRLLYAQRSFVVS